MTEYESSICRGGTGSLEEPSVSELLKEFIIRDYLTICQVFTMQNYHLPLKAPTPLPVQGVDTVTFKVWKNTLVAYLEQDSAHFHFLPGGQYSTWTSSFEGKRIPALHADDPDKKVLDEKLNATVPTLTVVTHANACENLLNRRNAQLAKFITHTATLCYYTEQGDISDHSTSLQWIFDHLVKHYGLETKGANFLNIASISYKKGDIPQTFYKQYRAAYEDNLRKKDDRIKFNNDQVLTADEKLTPSFENAIILWALKEIDPRLPNKVKKTFGHQMTGNVTLKDLQPLIFQNIFSMIEELNEAEGSKALASLSLEEDSSSSNLNALNFRSSSRGKFQGRPSRGGRPQRGGARAPGFQGKGPQQAGRPGDKFCRICNLAGSDRKIFTSHEIGNCSRLTVRDLESLRDSLVVNGMITEEYESEEPTYFLQPGWDDVEAAGHDGDGQQ